MKSIHKLIWTIFIAFLLGSLIGMANADMLGTSTSLNTDTNNLAIYQMPCMSDSCVICGKEILVCENSNITLTNFASFSEIEYSFGGHFYGLRFCKKHSHLAAEFLKAMEETKEEWIKKNEDKASKERHEREKILEKIREINRNREQIEKDLIEMERKLGIRE